jgi:transposase
MTTQKRKETQMNVDNLTNKYLPGNNELQDNYQHYIALDWSMNMMAIARLKDGWRQPKVVERSSDLAELKLMLDNLTGKKILTIEETTSTHWLYLELCDYVDRLIICDPYRNRLLSDGPKTDKIDAGKLCLLLQAGLLKEVFHSLSDLYQLRRLASAYSDVVKAGVRLQNQKAAFLKVEGLRADQVKSKTASFIIDHIDEDIKRYRDTKEDFEKQFRVLCRHNEQLKRLKSIPGIGDIGAVRILAQVIDAHRFKKSGHYLSYCGLVKLEKLSGGRSYGKKNPRYSRILKSVYKTAALASISGNNPIREYYDDLLEKGLAEHNARNAVARYIAKVSYGMLKSGLEYQPYKWRECSAKSSIIK